MRRHRQLDHIVGRRHRGVEPRRACRAVRRRRGSRGSRPGFAQQCQSPPLLRHVRMARGCHQGVAALGAEGTLGRVAFLRLAFIRVRVRVRVGDRRRGRRTRTARRLRAPARGRRLGRVPRHRGGRGRGPRHPHLHQPCRPVREVGALLGPRARLGFPPFVARRRERSSRVGDLRPSRRRRAHGGSRDRWRTRRSPLHRRLRPHEALG